MRLPPRHNSAKSVLVVDRVEGPVGRMLGLLAYHFGDVLPCTPGWSYPGDHLCLLQFTSCRSAQRGVWISPARSVQVLHHSRGPPTRWCDLCLNCRFVRLCSSASPTSGPASSARDYSRGRWSSRTGVGVHLNQLRQGAGVGQRWASVGPALGQRSGAVVPAALDFLRNLFRR